MAPVRLPCPRVVRRGTVVDSRRQSRAAAGRALSKAARAHPAARQVDKEAVREAEIGPEARGGLAGHRADADEPDRQHHPVGRDHRRYVLGVLTRRAADTPAWNLLAASAGVSQPDGMPGLQH